MDNDSPTIMTTEEKVDEIIKVMDYEIDIANYDSVRIPKTVLKAWRNVLIESQNNQVRTVGFSRLQIPLNRKSHKAKN